MAAHEGARALAGGQTLVNVMKARAASPDVLVDLNRLDELRAISVAGDTLELGAMATYTQIMDSSEVDGRAADPGRGRAQIADVQVRNRGTIGGNVCSNDPTNHLPPLLVALGASMTIRGEAGERTVPAEEFFLGVYMTAVGEGELLHVGLGPGGRERGGRLRVDHDRHATAPCIANAAASLAGGVGADRARLRRRRARPADAGGQPTRRASARPSTSAALDPPSDVHASADYRRHLAEVCAVRAVAQAAERGQ